MLQALEVSVILEKFPKSVIDVYAMVIESDGGTHEILSLLRRVERGYYVCFYGFG